MHYLDKLVPSFVLPSSILAVVATKNQQAPRKSTTSLLRFLNITCILFLAPLQENVALAVLDFHDIITI